MHHAYFSYASLQYFSARLYCEFCMFVEPLHLSSFRLYCLLTQRVSEIIPKHENWNPPPASSSA